MGHLRMINDGARCLSGRFTSSASRLEQHCTTEVDQGPLRGKLKSAGVVATGAGSEAEKREGRKGVPVVAQGTSPTFVRARQG